MIHTTVGVYLNLNCGFKSNGVKSEHLAEHIKYNLECRGGRALFVDGFCLHNGYLTDKEIESVQEQIDKIKHDTCTAPYV